MSEKEKSFQLFDAGFRPFQIYDQVKVKKHTLYWYFQEWKKLQKARELEAEEIERETQLQLEAEERAEILQQEASERVNEQQRKIKQLVDKLHAIETTISQYQWFPNNLLMDWLRFKEINNAYSGPEQYLEALKRQRDALRIRIKEVSSRQALSAFKP
jgi:hypothetical protein